MKSDAELVAANETAELVARHRQPLIEFVTGRVGDAAAAAPNPAMLAAMDRATAHMQDGGDGSRRLYACCCRGVEHGGSDGEIVATIRRYAECRPFPRRWSDAEIVQRMRHESIDTTMKYYVAQDANDIAASLWKTAGEGDLLGDP
ncbi:MAG: hypothetical protein IT424_06140 [Pirellulales bacterium]|nr:hypothetical protein [Pirellulales bacterium]